MRHEISTAEAQAIRKARRFRPVCCMSSIELAAEAAKGNRAAAERLQELNDDSAAELRAGTR